MKKDAIVVDFRYMALGGYKRKEIILKFERATEIWKNNTLGAIP